MKSYTLEKLTEARDALERNDVLTANQVLRELVEKYKLMLKPFDKPKRTQEIDYGNRGNNQPDVRNNSPIQGRSADDDGQVL
jgi:hypothetical protein